MRPVSIALAAALLLAGTVAGAATDQENLAKTLDKYLSLTFPPKKGLCLHGRHRHRAREARRPHGAGIRGAIIHPISEPCDDFVPLGK